MKFIEENKFKDNIGIYKIVNLINNKVYVGQTKESFRRRFWLHRWELKNNKHPNKHLQNSWNKYGEDNFIYEVLEICAPDNLDEKEKYWIKEYRKINKSYNMQDGGQPEKLNSFISPETRKEVGRKNRERMLGTKLSEETKNKMAESRKGKRIYRHNDTLTDEQAIAVKKMLVDGYSSKDITNRLNIEYKSVNKIISNNAYSTLFVEGWDEFLAKHKENALQRKQRGKEIIRLYNEENMTVQQIAKKFGVDRNVVNYHIKKHNK